MSKGGYGTFGIGLAGSLKNVIWIERNLKGWMLNRQKMDPALDEAVGIILTRIRARFREQKTATGEPWVPSKASTREKTLMHKGGRVRRGGTLWRTGNLYRSIQEGDSLDHGRRRTIEATAVSTRGSYPVRYGNILQRMNNWKFLDSGPSDKEAILSMMIRRFG